MLVLELSCLGGIWGCLSCSGWAGLARRTRLAVVIWCLPSGQGSLGSNSSLSVLAVSCCPSPPHRQGSRFCLSPLPTTAPWQLQPPLLDSVPSVPVASPAAAEVHECPLTRRELAPPQTPEVFFIDFCTL